MRTSTAENIALEPGAIATDNYWLKSSRKRGRPGAETNKTKQQGAEGLQGPSPVASEIHSASTVREFLDGLDTPHACANLLDCEGHNLNRPQFIS